MNEMNVALSLWHKPYSSGLL